MAEKKRRGKWTSYGQAAWVASFAGQTMVPRLRDLCGEPGEADFDVLEYEILSEATASRLILRDNRLVQVMRRCLEKAIKGAKAGYKGGRGRKPWQGFETLLAKLPTEDQPVKEWTSDTLKAAEAAGAKVQSSKPEADRGSATTVAPVSGASGTGRTPSEGTTAAAAPDVAVCRTGCAPDGRHDAADADLGRAGSADGAGVVRETLDIELPPIPVGYERFKGMRLVAARGSDDYLDVNASSEFDAALDHARGWWYELLVDMRRAGNRASPVVFILRDGKRIGAIFSPTGKPWNRVEDVPDGTAPKKHVTLKVTYLA